MYFDEPAPAFGGRTDPVEGVLLTVAAVVISPLGWPLLGYLEVWTGAGREGAVLTATVRTVSETGSTNVDMAELARNGASEGLWLRAERQTAGKGRQGRARRSPTGNLYVSTLVRTRPGEPLARYAGAGRRHRP